MINKKLIGDMLNTNPLSLLSIKDKEVIDYLNNLVPYSTGFEIECDMGENYKEDNFKDIPGILAVQVDFWEQRYRIPNGLKGIICLYNICYQLKVNSLLNPLSSIHYHIDCKDCFNKIMKLITRDKEWILKELDTWLEGGETANSRDIGSWFRINSLGTVEFRLGEMTFNYRTMLKRIIHCNSIVKVYKDEIGVKEPVFEPVNFEANKNYLLLRRETVGPKTFSKELEEIQRQIVELDKRSQVIPTEEIQVRSRVHKL